jgi:hypothetical protein
MGWKQMRTDTSFPPGESVVGKCRNHLERGLERAAGPGEDVSTTGSVSACLGSSGDRAVHPPRVKDLAWYNSLMFPDTRL